MIQKLKYHLDSFFPFLNYKKLLIAVSGGIDSMVLLHCFNELNFEIAGAHCNFQLRANESLKDEEFVENFCSINQIPYFVKKFNTKILSKKSKLSIQLIARKIRYDWFYELLKFENYDYILTAHHSDDNLETFIINLSRGTGIEGLTGIPAYNDKIIRPFLIFSKQEIEDFANENKIQFRVDASNLKKKYLRNKIRHDVIPSLKRINPNFLNTFNKSQNYLKNAQNLIQDAINFVYRDIAIENEKNIYFDINKIKFLNNYKIYIYYFLKKYGFSAWDDVYNLIEKQTGKHILSNNYILLKDRNFLILSPLSNINHDLEYLIEENQKSVNLPIKLAFCDVNDISNFSKETIFVDKDKLHFPLILKHWNDSEKFQPLGMGGKTKLVSKFFKDEKLNILEKQKIWILYSSKEVLWIIGMRQDERFKVLRNTKNILKMTVEF